MSEKLRVGFLGFGAIGSRRTQALQATGRIEIAAVCRRSPDKLAVAQAFTGAEHAFTDWREMLAQETLDAVVILTPHDLHYEQAKAVLERGLHLLVEKPIALRSEEAWEIVRLAQAKGLTLQTIYGDRLSSVGQAIKQAIESGAVGKLLQVNLGFSCYRRYFWQDDLPQQRRDFAQRGWGQAWTRAGVPEALQPDLWSDGNWRLDPKRIGGGALTNPGGHHVDMALWLGGGPAVEVFALAENAGLPVPIALSVSARLSNGVLLSLSMADIPPDAINWVVQGDAATLTSDGRTGITRQDMSNKTEIEPAQPINAEAAFVATVLDGEPNACPGLDGAYVVSLVEAIHRSLDQGGLVKVDIPADMR